MHFARGVLVIVASALAGALWTWSGPAQTFGAGAAFAALGWAALQLLPHGSAR